MGTFAHSTTENHRRGVNATVGADVDQWLPSWAKESVRRRFLELEIDGEMLSLLEKSDLVGGMGENGIKTGMDVVTAFGGTSEEGIIEVDRLMREITILKRAHGVPLSPGAESVATDGANEDDTSLLDASSSGSPSPPHIDSQDFSKGTSLIIFRTSGGARDLKDNWHPMGTANN